MSIKPEFSLRQVKETFKTAKYEIPKGAFIGRLYWSDFSRYVPTGVKLDGCYVVNDNKLQYHRKVEFVITNLETAEMLLKQCAKSNLSIVRKTTATVIQQMRGWIGGGVQLLKPIINAVKSTVTSVKKTVTKAAQSVARRFPKWQPEKFSKCKNFEQVFYLFSRCPESQMKEGFINNFYSALERVCPKTNLFADVWDEVQLAEEKPGQELDNYSLDDLVQVDYIPGEIQMEAVEVERVPATKEQVKQIMREAFNKNSRRCKQWCFNVNAKLPVQYLVKMSKNKKGQDLFNILLKNVINIGFTVAELKELIAGA